MNTYMVVFTGSERSDFELFNSCSQKQVIVDFYEFVGGGSLSLELFEKMVRNISIAEAVEACNALSSFYKIEGIYGNLEEVWRA